MVENKWNSLKSNKNDKWAASVNSQTYTKDSWFYRFIYKI